MIPICRKSLEEDRSLEIFRFPEAPNYGRYAPFVWGLRESTPTPLNGTQARRRDDGPSKPPHRSNHRRQSDRLPLRRYDGKRNDTSTGTATGARLLSQSERHFESADIINRPLPPNRYQPFPIRRRFDALRLKPLPSSVFPGRLPNGGIEFDNLRRAPKSTFVSIR